MANKIAMLDKFFDEINPLVVGISETWIQAENIKFVSLQNYKIVSSFSRNTHIHGGTAIFVRSDIINECKPLKTLNNLSIEISFECSAICLNKKSCIVTLYRSPLGIFDIFITQFTKLLQIVIKKYENIYICGDLNIDKLKNNIENHILHDLLSSYGLNSLILEPTRVACGVNGISQTAIDYLISNVENVRHEITDPGISDHSAQILYCPSRDIKADSTVENSKDTYRTINEHTTENFKFFFKNVADILANSNCNDIDEYFELFWSEFVHSFERAFPKKQKISRKQRQTKYQFKFSWELQKESENLRELNNLRKMLNDDTINKQYNVKRNQYKKNVIKERQIQNKNKIQNSKNKTKTLWQIVNSNLNKTKTSHDKIVLNQNNKIIDNNKAIADLFSAHYSNIIKDKLAGHFTEMSKECTSSEVNNNKMHFSPVKVEEVRDTILQLADKKSTGIDEVPIKLIKDCINEFSLCFTYIINKSILLGNFPNRLKTALIIPVYKKGNAGEINNYRPISLLSVFSKIIEKVMANRIVSFLNENDLLTSSQHGFRSKFSTETATNELIQNVYEELDAKNYVMGVFFDLSNAFDTLDLSFVSDKLNKLGIRDNLNEWIVSYLTARKIIVKVEKSLSYEEEINIGTPQGSVLGPLIFLLYINDLPRYINSANVYMYADDTSFIVTAKSPEELERNVNNLLRLFNDWCFKNRLIINYEKTICINFITKQKKIEYNFNINLNNYRVMIHTETKFLGTIIDANLSFTSQVHHLCKKLGQSCFAINSLKHNLDQKSLLSVYYALVYSQIAYNIIAYGNSTDIQRVFVIQKRIIRSIYNLGYIESCRDIFKREKILTVTSIYLYKLLIYIFVNKNKLKTYDHHYGTRNRDEIYISRYNLSLYKRSPICAGSYFFNKLPSDIKSSTTIKRFKQKLRSFLVENCFYSVEEFSEF